MPTELRVQAVHKGGMKMLAGNGAHEVLTDYPLQPNEQAAGLKPLELLLASVAACGGSTVALLLERMKQPVAAVQVEVKGMRRDEHPTVFTDIAVEFVLRGQGIDAAAVEKAIAQADKICPVWAMLKPGTTLRTGYRIVAD